jgi:hypothetical protein
LKCAVCDRRSGKRKYCRSHKKAYKNVVRGYDKWKEALDISWKDYLSQIADNALTGEWTKEVVQYLMKSGEQRNVKDR